MKGTDLHNFVIENKEKDSPIRYFVLRQEKRL